MNINELKRDTMIFEYVRNAKGKKIGVVVALSPYQIGYSLCKKCDKFDPELGMRIARGRADFGTDCPAKIPHTIMNSVVKMQDRAKRYFKNG